MSTKPPNSAKPFDDFRLQNFAPKPPQPPTVPSPLQLTERPVERKRPGLFREMLQEDPGVLYYDALDHPDRYDPEVLHLLEQLVAGRRVVTEEERALLDVATLEYATAPSPAHEAVRTELVKRVEKKMQPTPETPPDGPEADMPAFWWLR